MCHDCQPSGRTTGFKFNASHAVSRELECVVGETPLSTRRDEPTQSPKRDLRSCDLRNLDSRLGAQIPGPTSLDSLDCVALPKQVSNLIASPLDIDQESSPESRGLFTLHCTATYRWACT